MYSARPRQVNSMSTKIKESTFINKPKTKRKQRQEKWRVLGKTSNKNTLKFY